MPIIKQSQRQSGQGSKRLRQLLSLALVVVAALGFGVVSSTTATAVGCYGDYCSGQDPQNTGCSADGYTAAAVNASQFRLEVRYSPTCKTNWARITVYSPGLTLCTPPGQLIALQDTGYQQGTYVPNHCMTHDGPWTYWTPMIYSPVHLVQARFLQVATAWA